MSPFFVKYRTPAGRCYIYDVATNEIIHVGETIYALIDDFHVLGEEEIIAKYPSRGADNVHRALRELARFQARGILCDHSPLTVSRGERVLCRGKEDSLVELLGSRRRLLLLELTQNCNLQCEYCCYGPYYTRSAGRGDAVLPLEVAKAAIRDFIDHRPEKCGIGFYGGEPLLEFDLLKQIVYYATDYARRRGMEPKYSMTTNGTLLGDEQIHFLVAHGFNVHISLDGPKEAHDRYRVFKAGDGNHERKRGSYDCVMNNLRRFAELYPDYTGCTIALTLTATSDIEAIDDWMSPLQQRYRLVNPNYVRTPDACQKGRRTADARLAPSDALRCESGSCRRETCVNGRDDSVCATATVHGNCELSASLENRPGFCNWTDEWNERYRSSRNRYTTDLCQADDSSELQRRYPVSSALFYGQMKSLHFRVVSRRPPRFVFAYRCYPGASRTFCSSRGFLYPCERTEAGELFKLGDAHSGVDVNRSLRLTEQLRLLSDCGNCAARMVCTLCPAAVLELNDSGRPDALMFQRGCTKQAVNLQVSLEEYTRIMETNRDVVDRVVRKDASDDWLDDVKCVLTDEQMKETQGELEELENMV